MRKRVPLSPRTGVSKTIATASDAEHSEPRIHILSGIEVEMEAEMEVEAEVQVEVETSGKGRFKP